MEHIYLIPLFIAVFLFLFLITSGHRHSEAQKKLLENSKSFFDALGYPASSFIWAPSPHGIAVTKLGKYGAYVSKENQEVVILRLRKEKSAERYTATRIALDDVMEVRFNVDSHTVTHSRSQKDGSSLIRGVIGMAVAGGAGAVVGAVSAGQRTTTTSSSTEKISHISVLIVAANGNLHNEIVLYSGVSMPSTSTVVKDAMKQAEILTDWIKVEAKLF